MATKYWLGATGLRLILLRLTYLAARGLSAHYRQILTTLRRIPGVPGCEPVDAEIIDGDWLSGRTGRELAGPLLSPLPDRWAHTQAAAAQAQLVAGTVPAGDREFLIAAAWLHDIGYAAEITDTGFHPIDGARYLRRLGAPMRLAALVAHHSEAHLLAEARGLLDELDEFPQEHLPIRDALSYADMTAWPTSAPGTPPKRPV